MKIEVLAVEGAAPILHNGDGLHLAKVAGSEFGSPIEAEENRAHAARLAASWNACERLHLETVQGLDVSELLESLAWLYPVARDKYGEDDPHVASARRLLTAAGSPPLAVEG